jgi:hypothetical protein
MLVGRMYDNVRGSMRQVIAAFSKLTVSITLSLKFFSLDLLTFLP